MGINDKISQPRIVPPGQVATIISHLEMWDKPVLASGNSSLSLSPWPEPDTSEYYRLFRAVGEPWLWISRLLMEPAKLERILQDPGVTISIVRDKDRPVGFVELDFRVAGHCEIVFFGLIPDYSGKGHGQWLMSRTLEMAWREGVERVWLHTCTQDSPRALPFYQKCGFSIFKQETDMMEDPRLNGYFPLSAAPHVPILR